MRKIIATVAILVVSLFGLNSANAATVNKGCTKVGSTSGTGAMKLTCKKVNGKLKWVLTPAATTATAKPSAKPTSPAAKVGTFSTPVPVNTFAQVGNFSYRFDSSNNDVTAAACALSGFTDGCTYDSNLDRIIDPKATGRWVALTVTATNMGNDIARPGGYLTSFEIVLPNGKLLASDSGVLENELGSISLIPGGQATGVIMFYVEKSISIPDLIVVRDQSSFSSTQTVYFRIAK